MLNIPGVIWLDTLTDEETESEYYFTTEVYTAVINGKQAQIYTDVFEDKSVMLQIIDDDCENIVPDKPFPSLEETAEYIKALL